LNVVLELTGIFSAVWFVWTYAQFEYGDIHSW